MQLEQFIGCRRWNFISDDETFGVFWWRVNGGTGKIFIDLVGDYFGKARHDNEKSFRESMKGYGEIVQYREMTVAEIEEELYGEGRTAGILSARTKPHPSEREHILRPGPNESVHHHSKTNEQPTEQPVKRRGRPKGSKT